MSEATTAMTRLAFAAGIVSVALGVATLMRHRVFAWARRRPLRWKPFGWSQVLMGVWVIVETVPRLAAWPAVLVLATSIVALVPVIGAGVLQTRARRPEPTGSVSSSLV
jgi:hypothetical protein